MKSVVKYKNRGKWGDNKYRGNCTGHLFIDLIEHFQPKLFVDACMGSGTSKEVCKELGTPFIGLDLRHGFNFLKDSILHQLPFQADICFTHPPYHNLVTYSGDQWGESNKFDLSRCGSYDEFLEKSQVMLLNQREATRDGGIYCTLIGDLRKNGHFHSTQADYQSLMPKSELSSIVIKVQNNHASSFKSYSGNFISIQLEYLVIWKKKLQSFWAIGLETASSLKSRINMTWRSIIRIALMNLSNKASLSHIYDEVLKIAGEKIKSNSNWKAKIRQQLQIHFASVERGIWAI